MLLFLERQCGRTPGIAYAVVGGCPLTILGGTGPVLIFTELLYKFCHSIDVDFLPFYAWTGVWIGVMVRARPGAVGRPGRVPKQIRSVWRFCMGAQGA